ncbi:hypothetical protein D3C78_946150 [compost metagenome]
MMSVKIKWNSDFTVFCGFDSKLEEMMSVLCIKLLAAKPVNPANHLSCVVAMCKKCSFNLIHHISAMPACGISTVSDGDRFYVFQSLSNLLLWKRTDDVGRDGAGLDSFSS